MRVLCVCRDIGGSEGLRDMGSELRARGHEVALWLGFAKPISCSEKDIFDAVRNTDVVVSGRSSTPGLSHTEIAVIEEAVLASKPFAIYSDNFTVVTPWMEELAQGAHTLMVVSNAIIEQTAQQFPNARVVATGNPRWEQFCFPRYSRDQVREKLGWGKFEKVILSPGLKVASVNLVLWNSVLEALSHCDLLGAYHLAASLHPGDKNPPEIYDEFADFFPPEAFSVHRKTEDMTSSDLLVGADLVVDSTSTTATEAAHLRIPVITHFSATMAGWMRHIRGNTSWEPCELGANAKTVTELELARTIVSLTTSGGFPPYRRRQEELFPQPAEQGTAARKMADAVEAMVA